MYLCYVDESGDTGAKGSRHLLLGAAALFEGRWSYVKQDIEALLGRYFPVGLRPAEVHCTDVRHGRGPYSRLRPDQRAALLNDLCQAVTAMLDVEVRLFTVVYDKGWWAARNPGKSGEDLYLDAFENLVSRFDLFLRRRRAEDRPSKGVMIVDPHSTSLSAALRSALHRFQSSGTRWATLYNVIEAVMFLDSHESPGLQLADLCSYAVWRLAEFGDEGLVRQLAAAFDREPMTSTVSPGKWHGVKYFGADPVVAGAIKSVFG